MRGNGITEKKKKACGERKERAYKRYI